MEARVSIDFKESVFGTTVNIDGADGKTMKVKIPAGIDDGMSVRIRGKGGAAPEKGGEPGDLYVRVRVKPDKRFTRDGYNIISETHVDMVEAALGTEIDVETVDGTVTIKVPAGTQSGTPFRLSGHGFIMRQDGDRGAHYVHIIVDTPTKLSKRQREILEEFRDPKNKKRGFWG